MPASLSSMPPELVTNILFYVGECLLESRIRGYIGLPEGVRLPSMPSEPAYHSIGAAKESKWDLSKNTTKLTGGSKDACWCRKCMAVSWPDGLPEEPTVSLALVNRTFLHCCSMELYRSVTLTDMYAASLFLRSIKAACAFPPLIDSEDFLALTSDAKGKGQADTVSPSKTRQGTLADLVREFRIYNHSDSSKQGISMGRGGGSMIRDIIATIPKLEKVELRVDMLDHCKKPIYDVLVSKIGLKTLMLQSGLQNDTILVQFKELVEHILSKDNCKDLQSLDVSLLDGCPSQRLNFLRSWPTVTSHLKSIHLLRPHVTAAHLETHVYKVLRMYGGGLKTLFLALAWRWHPIQPVLGPNGIPTSSTDPTKSPFILDALFRAGALPKVEHLLIAGPIVSSNALPWVPDSVERPGLTQCPHVKPGTLAKYIAGWRKKTRVDGMARPVNGQPAEDGQPEERVRGLPNLKCLYASGSDVCDWTDGQAKAMTMTTKARKICFHEGETSPWWPNGSTGLECSEHQGGDGHLNDVFGDVLQASAGAFFGGTSPIDESANGATAPPPPPTASQPPNATSASAPYPATASPALDFFSQFVFGNVPLENGGAADDPPANGAFANGEQATPTSAAPSTPMSAGLSTPAAVDQGGKSSAKLAGKPTQSMDTAKGSSTSDVPRAGSLPGDDPSQPHKASLAARTWNSPAVSSSTQAVNQGKAAASAAPATSSSSTKPVAASASPPKPMVKGAGSSAGMFSAKSGFNFGNLFSPNAASGKPATSTPVSKGASSSPLIK